MDLSPLFPPDVITGRGKKRLVDILAGGVELTATEHHPFWVESAHEWIDAEDLLPGDVLLTADGQRLVVEHIDSYTTVVRTVHNLTVDDLHTYFVLVGQEPVLVHNATCRVNAGEYFRNNVPREVDNKWMALFGPESHHPIPTFMGGHENQVLHTLSNDLHGVFHTMLDFRLQERGLGLSALTSRTAEWEALFTRVKGSQRQAIDTLLATAREFDTKLGTELFDAVRRGLTRGRITWF